ncbi:MAG: PepSY-like domain-containing protein [Flavisolibacter sp.]|nr:PepSY-like domain-containing protein [Flavisolibacter sp.]
MKKNLAVILIMFISFCGYAQKLDVKKVPKAVKDAFKQAHPNSIATWEWEDANYEANFEEGGKTMSCVINRHGTILETESSITASDLPANVKAYMNQHYKGKKWKEVAKIVKANGDVNYEVNVGTDVLFDANGKHIEKKEEKGKD